MLIEFRVENHRSLYEEQALSLEAAYRHDDADPRSRVVDGHSEPLVASAALYGANASGKSNVLEALAFMKEAIDQSHRRWEPDDGVPRDPFAWGKAVDEPSLFEATFVDDGTRYRYGFVADDRAFVEEWLYAWPKGRRQTWFERDGDRFKYGEHLKGDNKVVEQITRPNALFLSAAVQLGQEQLQPIHRWFGRLVVEGMARSRRQWAFLPLEHRLSPLLGSRRQSRQISLFPAEPSGATDRARPIVELLRAADVGIVDLKVVEEDESPRSAPYRRRPRPRWRILVRHRHDSDDAWLPVEEESHGTQTLLRIAPSLVSALRNGSVLAIDELEAGLHPLLAAHIIQRFHDPATNPNGAQLLFTTHDTNLLGTMLGEDPLLRRDQVWLTEKDEQGATALVPLSDYKPRKEENLERGYLQGRYGGVPILDDLVTPADE